MRYPLNKVYITQAWGVNRDIYSRFGFLGHNGTDLRLFDEQGNKATTALLFSPHSGKVIEMSFDKDGYGEYLKIENDVEGSILGHLLSSIVSVGQEVKEGEFLGWCDNTGWSTGSHLHWGYYRKPRNKANGYGGTIDPTPYIKPENKPIGGQEDMSKVLDYYHVKNEDELIHMVDEQLKFLADGRKEIDRLRGELQKQSEYAGTLDTQIESLQAEIGSLKTQQEMQLQSRDEQIDLLKTEIQSLRDSLATEISEDNQTEPVQDPVVESGLSIAIGNLVSELLKIFSRKNTDDKE